MSSPIQKALNLQKEKSASMPTNVAETEFNDELAQRQAEVRAALSDLYSGEDGYARDTSTSQSRNPSDGHKHEELPRMKLAFEEGMSMDDGESLSFDPIVATDGTETTGIQNRAGTGTAIFAPGTHHNDGQSSEGDTLSSFSLNLLCDLDPNTSILNSNSVLGLTHDVKIISAPDSESDLAENSALMAPSYHHKSLQSSTRYISEPVKDADNFHENNTNAHNVITERLCYVEESNILNAYANDNAAENDGFGNIDGNGNGNGDCDSNTTNESKQLQDLGRKINELQNINSELQEQITIIHADQVLTARSPTKFQIELDSIRLAADQVQQEADERVKAIEAERDNLMNMLEEIERNRNRLTSTHNGVSENSEVNDVASVYEVYFFAVLEQLCLLGETSLQIDTNYTMDQIVKAALKNSSVDTQSPQLEHKIQRYLDRLKKGCGTLNSTILNTAYVGGDHQHYATKHRSGNSNKTGDLMPGRQNLSFLINEETWSTLKLENASLKGSNEHMKEQLERYKQQVNSSKAPSASKARTGVQTTSSSFLPPDPYFQENYKELKQSNFQLIQQIRTLDEGKRAVEEENAKVTHRCIMLEQIAADATRECERLSHNSAHKGDEIESIRKERDDLLTLQTNYKETNVEREKEHEHFRIETKSELEKFQDKCNCLVESSNTLKRDLDLLTNVKVDLESKLKVAECLIADQQKQLTRLKSLSEETKQEQPKLVGDAKSFSQELQSLSEENNGLRQQIKEFNKRNAVQDKSGNLHDECSRLRNLNGMIKSKIELIQTELDLAKKEKSVLIKKSSSLQEEIDLARAENVSLSDIKTDLQMQLTMLGEQSNGQKDAFSRIQTDLNNITSHRDELLDKNAELSHQCSLAEQSLANGNGRIVELSQEKKNAEYRIEQLLENLNHLEPRMQNHERHVVFEEVSPMDKSDGGNFLPRVRRNNFVGVQTPESTQTHKEIVARFPLDNSLPHAEDKALSTIRTPSFDSREKTMGFNDDGVYEPTELSSTKSMDEQLKRITSAKERAARTLKNVHHFQSTTFHDSKFKTVISAQRSQNIPPLSDNTINRSGIDRTEDFVNGILSSCGKQRLSV